MKLLPIKASACESFSLLEPKLIKIWANQVWAEQDFSQLNEEDTKEQ